MIEAMVNLAQELHRHAGEAALGMRVTVWVPDPYTKARLTEGLTRRLKDMVPPSLAKDPDTVFIEDEIHVCGIIFEFREQGHPTQIEELANG